MIKIGNPALMIGGITVVVAILALGFILYSITSFSERCEIEVSENCARFTQTSFPILLVTLIIGGLVLVASTVVYILVTA